MEKAKLKGGLIFFAGLLVLISIAFNIYLSSKILQYYKAINLLRIDPLETRMLKEVELENKDRVIILFGDSRIAEWRPKLNVAGWTIINRGINGQTTDQLILRLKKDVLDYSPAVVVLQAGINDLKGIGLFPEYQEAIILRCKDNLLRIMEKLSAERIETVVLTIFPPDKPGFLRSWFWPDKIGIAIRDINAFIEADRNNRIHVVDSGSILGKGGYVRNEFKRDMLHINAKGYEKLNEHLQPYLNSLLNKN